MYMTEHIMENISPVSVCVRLRARGCDCARAHVLSKCVSSCLSGRGRDCFETLSACENGVPRLLSAAEAGRPPDSDGIKFQSRIESGATRARFTEHLRRPISGE